MGNHKWVDEFTVQMQTIIIENGQYDNEASTVIASDSNMRIIKNAIWSFVSFKLVKRCILTPTGFIDGVSKRLEKC